MFAFVEVVAVVDEVIGVVVVVVVVCALDISTLRIKINVR